ncbi:hypothetical protein [Nocardia sp. NPDC127526]|uniref:hypothetical protein n=1 Tax=Nocardia sp. NPDC127526 TaxID=3345393 RepID=UPI00363BB4A3
MKSMQVEVLKQPVLSLRTAGALASMAIAETALRALADRAAAEPTAAWVNAVLPRIDLGVASEVAEISRMLCGPGTTRQAAIMSAAVADALKGVELGGAPDPLWVRGVVQLLGNWEILHRAGHRGAGNGLRAARQARWAVLNRLADRADKVVADFAARWLKVKWVGPDVIEAVSAALLDDDWMVAADPLGTLLKGMKNHRRVLKMLGHQVLRGGRIRHLSEPVAGTMGGTLADSVAAPDTWLGTVKDARVMAVLDSLTPEDREIAWAYGHHRTWEEAARHCGYPPERGESVRRKLKYAGRKLLEQQGTQGALIAIEARR